MGILGGRPLDDAGPAAPLDRSSRQPPKVWGALRVEGDAVVVTLSGWRAVWAVQRRLRIPVGVITGVTHEPAVYVIVSTKLRKNRRARSTTFKLGSQHGREGWSFWACGYGRNAVLIETAGFRYRYVVVEVAEPAASVRAIAQASGLAPPPPPPPTPRTRSPNATPAQAQAPLPGQDAASPGAPGAGAAGAASAR